MDELAGSRADFKALTGHVEDEGGDESRLRSYRSTGEWRSRVRFDRQPRRAAELKLLCLSLLRALARLNITSLRCLSKC